MGIWDLKWTSQRDFSVAGGIKVGFAMVHFHAKTVLRFEFIVHNHHHTPAFESRVVTVLAPVVPYVSHQDGLEEVEMGIWDLKWTSQRDFSVAGGVKVGLALVHFPGQDCVSLD
eukprot:scaffold33699_cov36-Cyclotella_meneghiniana.AAC.1